ncbi:O-antigen ligase family protein [Flammeovirga aprica]|uniref:O-antigen ligase-related domain-containing protein n=1 Tax=Flammeovirga aprica JL-4 TaxID=694437 RepID=A0A7X9XCY6_9BACT|nr:O-antigen ligase family protein [Flammeovirga aprica]NME72223.1 hypothetical protein [Flammeovirga aprica JL-4]
MYIKKLIYFIFFGTILYFEALSISGVKISLLWKFILIIIPFTHLFFSSKKKIDRITYIYLLFSLSVIINTDVFYHPFDSISDFFKLLPFVLAYHYGKILSTNNLLKIIYNVSQFVLLSTIPFQLNLIKPLNSGYDLSIYGIDKEGFIGIFQNPHSASITLAISLSVYIVIGQNFSKSKVSYLLLIAFGSFSLYLTYVRTGWAIFIIFISVYNYKKIKLKSLPALTLLLFILMYSYNYIKENDKTLQYRVSDTTIYNNNSSNNLGSGRVRFFIAGLEVFYESSFFEKIWGIGNDIHERMKPKTNLSIRTHNGYSDVLLMCGIIGFSLFLIFHWHYLIMILKTDSFKFLNLAMFSSYIILNLSQGGNFFIFDILQGFILAFSNHEEYKRRIRI